MYTSLMHLDVIRVEGDNGDAQRPISVAASLQDLAVALIISDNSSASSVILPLALMLL